MNKSTKESYIQRQFSNWSSIYDTFVFRIYFTSLYGKLLHIFTENRNNKFYDGAKFLDLACGTAEVISQLARAYPKVEFVGTDFSAGMIHKAQKKTESLKNVSILEANVTNLPFPNKMFDVILCSEAFHHFYEPQKALSEMYRVGKENALFVLMDPAKESILEKLVFVFLARLVEKYHKIYSQTEMKTLLEQSGFELLSYSNFHLNNFFISRRK